MTNAVQDRWAQWVFERRFGGDREQLERGLRHLRRFRDRVLDRADLRPADLLLDVGAGDGLIAFGALERLGPEGRVIFSDVSEDLLAHCRGLAEELGALDRCEFVLASADDLSAFDDASVDVVTTRSVLIYLERERKRAALREFHRVLRPGGRLSFFEPINKFGTPEPPGWFCGYDLTEISELVEKVLAVVIVDEERPLIDFDERDLLEWAREAGFETVGLDYEVAIERGSWLSGSWDAVLKTAGNPLMPTIGEAIERALTPEEAETFEAHLRPLVEGDSGRKNAAHAYLRAVK